MDLPLEFNDAEAQAAIEHAVGRRRNGSSRRILATNGIRRFFAAMSRRPPSFIRLPRRESSLNQGERT
jgi:hypothetical protein